MTKLSAIALPEGEPLPVTLTPTTEIPFDVRAVGRYFVVYRDGVRLTQHTTEREALQQAIAEAEAWPDSAVKYVHEYEVLVSRLRRRLATFFEAVGATTAGTSTDGRGTAVRRGAGASAGVATPAGVGQAVTSSEWLSTPAPAFTIGTAANYDLTQHLASDGVGRTLTVATGTLPTGVTLDNTDGAQRLVYDGALGATTATGVSITSAVAAPASARSVRYVQNTSGNDDYGRLTTLPTSFGAGEFTFETWVKADNTLPVGSTASNTKVNWSSEDVQPYSSASWWYRGNFLLDGHNNGNVPQGTFSLQVVGGGRVRWLFGDGAAADARVGDLHAVQAWPSSGTNSILDGNWHKVVCVRRWDGGTGSILELWIDGALVASTTSTARTNMATAYWNGWSSWGAQQGWFFAAEKFSALGGADWEDYKGLVSETAFFSRAKTSTELANDWNRLASPGESGLIGLYRHNEGSGTTVAAATGSGLSGGAISLIRSVAQTWATDAPFSAADLDWLARSTAAGVVFAERFDTLQIGAGAGGGRYYNGDYGQRGFRDTTGPRCSGTGSLRLEHRPNENNPNMTGRYSRDTVDGGALLPNFAPGQVFYVQFRYRIDTNWYNNIPTWAGQGHKLILLHQNNISCGQIELSLQHYSSWYNTRILRMYTGCGTPNLFTNLTNPTSQTNPPFLVQQRWDIDGGSPYAKVPGYEIQYGAGSAAGAFAPQANTWYTFDFRVQLPSSWGASNCRVEAWVTEPGQTERQKFVAWIGAMFSNGEPTNFMNNLTLTGYLSNGASNATTTGSCWYDEVIVSTQPIALPTTLPVSP